MVRKFENFCKKIHHDFSNKNLLDEALTHPSLSKNCKIKSNYQRLEFLGDKVLSLIIAEFLMEEFPSDNEGDLSKRQASLVSGNILSEIALQVGVSEVLQISKGERNLGGETNKRNLENAIEALIGAIYLDSDYEKAKQFVKRFWHELLYQKISPPKDPVSELQELVQIKSKQLPKYFTQKSGGSEHAPTFISRVKIDYLNLEFTANGKSKKEAQREVAAIALGYFLGK